MRDLGVPHFLFELVKRSVYISLERQRDAGARRLLGTLLAELSRAQLLSERDLRVGFQSAVDNVAALRTDYGPQTAVVLGEMLDAAAKDGTLEAEFVAACQAQIPQRISEEEERLAAARTALSASANANNNKE